MPLKQLTDLIGIDRSSVFRLANTLRQRRFLANPKGSKDYILGPTAWRLSRRYGRTVLGTFFHHYLQDLRRRSARRRTSRSARASRCSSSTTTSPPARWCRWRDRPANSRRCTAPRTARRCSPTAICRALRELLGRGPLQAYTRSTVKSVTRLARVCAQVRVDGFALDDGEYIEEVTCVAAPIRDPQGEIVASVGISSPLTRLHTRGIARAAAEVRKTARAITASLAG